MTFRARATLLVAVICALGSLARALDREAFTFTRYDLKLEVDPAKGTLAASGTVQLRNDSNVPQSSVALQISSTLQWTSIAEGDTGVPFLGQTYTSDIDHTGELSEAIATLSRPVAPKGSITLRVSYRGTVPRNATRLTRIGAPAEYANAAEWDEITGTSTAMRGIGYVTWFPVALSSAKLSEGNTVLDTVAAWKARHSATVFQVALAVPQTPAPGTPVGIRWNSTRISPCAAQKAICSAATFDGFSSVPTFAVGPYETLERPAVAVSFRAEHASIARDYAAATERWQPLVAEWFGPAANKVHVIELAETSATPFDSGAFVFTPLRPLDRAALEFAMVHQLAHAAIVSPRPWIFEGLAHLMQAEVRERQAGRRGAIAYVAQFGRPLTEAQKRASTGGPDGKPAAQAVASQSLVTTNDPVYFRGKSVYVWWMLRDMLGAEALQAAVRSYRADQDTQPAYMQTLLEKSAPGTAQQNLEWFFDDWVYRDRGLPDFRIESAYPRKTLDGTYVVTVTVENLGKAGAEVPVTVSAAGGERSQRVLVQAGGKGVVRVQMPQPPTRATVNDGSVPETDVGNNSIDIKVVQQQ